MWFVPGRVQGRRSEYRTLLAYITKVDGSGQDPNTERGASHNTSRNQSALTVQCDTFQQSSKVPLYAPAGCVKPFQHKINGIRDRSHRTRNVKWDPRRVLSTEIVPTSFSMRYRMVRKACFSSVVLRKCRPQWRPSSEGTETAEAYPSDGTGGHAK